MLRLAGRGAILAGARRVGAVIAERLAAEGVDVAIVYRRSRDEAEALAAKLADGRGRRILIQADLADEADVQRLIETAKAGLDDLSFCINLASDFPRVPFEQLDAAAWERGMATARGTYLLAVHAARALMANEGPTRGQLVFFGDWAAEQTPYPDYLPYLTGKAAVHFMTRAFAVELAPHGILVNAILPGPTLRPSDLTPEEWQQTLRETPLHRTSDPEDIAELVVALLKSETVTGETIRVDSGRHVAGNAPPAEK